MKNEGKMQSIMQNIALRERQGHPVA